MQSSGLLCLRRRLRLDLLLVICCLQQTVSPAAGQLGKCTKQINSCQCQTDSGKYIDLAPLARKDDYRFKKIPSPRLNWVYSYNPCFGFSCEGANDVAVCQNDNSAPPQSFAIGTQTTAQFGYVLGTGLFITYTSDHTSTTRIAKVKLVCDTTQEGTFSPEDDGLPTGSSGRLKDSYTYSSTLTSKYACEVDSLPDNIGGMGGMSAGDILLIIFFVGAFLYLAVGFAVNVLVRKTPLGPGAVPNATFWVAVPGYVRDGAAFCVNKVRQLFTMRRGGGYESV